MSYNAFNETQDTVVLTPPKSTLINQRRLHTLEDLKIQQLRLESNANHYMQKKAARQGTLPLAWRILIWIFACIMSLSLLVVGGAAYLTSPFGEESMTAVVQNVVNHYGKDKGLRIQLSAIRGFWEGRIEILNLRVYDTYGPWLRITEGTLHPDWDSLVKSMVALVRFKRSKHIPKAFYEQNAPLVSTPIVIDKRHTTVLQNVPFYVENVSSSSSSSFPSTPEQSSAQNTTIQGARAKSLTPSTPRTKKTAEKAIVNNLLKPSDLLKGKVVFAIKSGTFIGSFMPRFPRYHMDSSPKTTNMQELFDFLPAWLAIDVAKIELVDFKLGPRSRSINFSTNVHGQINAEQLLLRSTLLAAHEIPTDWVLPSMQDLPDDVRITQTEMIKKLNSLFKTSAINDNQAHEEVKKRIIGYASIDYDKGKVDIRWQMGDSLLSKVFAKGVDSIWSRMRILAHIPAWPPNKQTPLQAYFIGRFGLTLTHNAQKIKSSLVSGQFFWDSDTFILRDFDLKSPNRETSIKAKGSLGYSLTKGFGAEFNASIKDLKTLAYIFGKQTTSSEYKGNIDTSIYISHSGDRILWWTKPLPKILEGSNIPGFKISPYDKSILAKNTQRFIKNSQLSVKEINHKTFVTEKLETASTTKTVPPAKTASTADASPKKAKASPFAATQLPPFPVISRGDDGFRFRFKMESKNFELEQGVIKDLFFTVTGSSVYEPSAPQAIFASSSAQNADNRNTAQDHNGATLSQPPPTVDDETNSLDFNYAGLPQALVGDVFLRFGDIFSQGSATMKSQWFLGGYQPGARMFLARLQNFLIDFPGFSSDANLAFSYALPRTKRRWPWIDGDFNVHIKNWDLLSKIFISPLRAENVQLYSTFKSVVDKQGKPSQFFDSKLLTDRVDATEFMVRHTESSAQSHHLHAMIDTMSLSVGRLREIVQKKLYYIPPKEVPLITAKLDIASGRGGPLVWNSGSGEISINGEQAKFTIRMLGEISAIIDGLFNFRTRTLSLKDMNLKTPISAKNKK